MNRLFQFLFLIVISLHCAGDTFAQDLRKSWEVDGGGVKPFAQAPDQYQPKVTIAEDNIVLANRGKVNYMGKLVEGTVRFTLDSGIADGFELVVLSDQKQRKANYGAPSNGIAVKWMAYKKRISIGHWTDGAISPEPLGKIENVDFDGKHNVIVQIRSGRLSVSSNGHTVQVKIPKKGLGPWTWAQNREPNAGRIMQSTLTNVSVTVDKAE